LATFIEVETPGAKCTSAELRAFVISFATFSGLAALDPSPSLFLAAFFSVLPFSSRFLGGAMLTGIGLLAPPW